MGIEDKEDIELTSLCEHIKNTCREILFKTKWALVELLLYN